MKTLHTRPDLHHKLLPCKIEFPFYTAYFRVGTFRRGHDGRPEQKALNFPEAGFDRLCIFKFIWFTRAFDSIRNAKLSGIFFSILLCIFVSSCNQRNPHTQDLQHLQNQTATLFEEEIPVASNEFKDSRDGQVYALVTIGTLTWFAENLNFDVADSYTYNDMEENGQKYGRLYKWEVALTACPKGWHLSTEFEWQYIEKVLGMEFRELSYTQNRGVDEGAKMKYGGSSGLEVLYGGWRRKNGTYTAVEENAAFWTATEADMDHAWHRDIDTGDDFVYRSRVVKSYGLSCRCVKNRHVKDKKEVMK